MLVDGGSPVMRLSRIADGAPTSAVLKRAGLLKRGEQLIELANGGSESLVFFVSTAAGSVFVRKVSSAGLSAARWQPGGAGVMSDPYERSRLQVQYLQSLPPSVASLFPTLYDVEQRQTIPDLGCGPALIADYEYIRGTPLSKITNARTGTVGTASRLYSRLADLLASRVHAVAQVDRTAPSVEKYHLSKVEARLQVVRESWPWARRHLHRSLPTITINDEKYMSAEACLAIIRSDTSMMAALEPPSFGLVVGDSNTQNVLLAGSQVSRSVSAPHGSTRIRFIDPRGIGPGRHDGLVVDDPIYDWKYWHNTLAHYDAIFAGEFRMRVREDAGSLGIDLAHRVPTPQAWLPAGLAASFRGVIAHSVAPDTPLAERYGDHWALRFLFTMGSHFAAMMPFHLTRSCWRGEVAHDTWESSSAALAMYCECVRWLNESIRHWYGERSFDEILATRFWR